MKLRPSLGHRLGPRACHVTWWRCGRPLASWTSPHQLSWPLMPILNKKILTLHLPFRLPLFHQPLFPPCSLRVPCSTLLFSSHYTTPNSSPSHNPFGLPSFWSSIIRGFIATNSVPYSGPKNFYFCCPSSPCIYSCGHLFFHHPCPPHYFKFTSSNSPSSTECCNTPKSLQLSTEYFPYSPWSSLSSLWLLQFG